jgi:Fic family protein
MASVSSVTDPLAPLLDLPGVLDAAARARAAIDELLGNRILRRRSAEVTAESALRGARASAQLEGAGIELERLRGQLLAGTPIETHQRDAYEGLVIDGAVRLHADLGQLVDVWRRSPRQALARMHVVAAHRLVDDSSSLGRPRSDEVVRDPLGLPAAPAPREVAARVDGLSSVLLSTTVPAVVVAAVVHGELLALRAFGVADGLVARAAARLVLIDRGLDPKAVSAPEVGHVELHHDYEHAAAGFMAGGPAGVARWVVHCCDAIALGAREGKAVCEVLRRESA